MDVIREITAVYLPAYRQRLKIAGIQFFLFPKAFQAHSDPIRASVSNDLLEIQISCNLTYTCVQCGFQVSHVGVLLYDGLRKLGALWNWPKYRPG